jgi:hypothetical protein
MKIFCLIFIIGFLFMLPVSIESIKLIQPFQVMNKNVPKKYVHTKITSKINSDKQDKKNFENMLK